MQVPINNIENITPKTNTTLASVVANIISYLFHPIFMPLYIALALYISNKAAYIALNNTSSIWIIVLILNTIFFPLIATLLLRTLGFIKSIKMEDPKDRIIPLIATMIFYFWAYRVFKNFDAPIFLRSLILGSFWGVIVIFMINIFYKVSMHTAAAGQAVVIAFLFLLSGVQGAMYLFIVTLLLAGLIGTARLQLKAHIPIEIWLGYFAGCITQIAAYFFLK